MVVIWKHWHWPASMRLSRHFWMTWLHRLAPNPMPSTK
jgi:hypothetical protein